MIRRIQKADACPFKALRNFEEVARYQDWPFPFTETDSAAFMEQMTSSHPDVAGEWFQFALVEDNTGGLIGDIGFCPATDGSAEVEIGFSLHPEHQGKGLMSEALAAVFDYLFDRRGKERVLAIVDTRNAPSIRLLERLGFMREKRLAVDPEVAEYVYMLTPVRWQNDRP